MTLTKHEQYYYMVWILQHSKNVQPCLWRWYLEFWKIEAKHYSMDISIIYYTFFFSLQIHENDGHSHFESSFSLIPLIMVFLSLLFSGHKIHTIFSYGYIVDEDAGSDFFSEA